MQPFTNFQSINWIQLTKAEFLIITVNYCFINNLNIERDLADNNIRVQFESHGGCRDYQVTKLRIWKKGMKEFTTQDKKLVNKYLKKCEAQQRKEKWGN